MTLIERQMNAANQYAELWSALLPDVELPAEDVFLTWAGCYSEKQIARGISGSARKLRAMRAAARPMSADDVLSYAASIMRNEAMGVRRFDR